VRAKLLWILILIVAVLVVAYFLGIHAGLDLKIQ
jgi:hypothetical protein